MPASQILVLVVKNQCPVLTIFECFEGGFEQNSLLGVDRLGVLGRNREELENVRLGSPQKRGIIYYVWDIRVRQRRQRRPSGNGRRETISVR